MGITLKQRAVGRRSVLAWERGIEARVVCTGLGLAGLAGAASGQAYMWSVTSLHPAGATSSGAVATDGTHQVGLASVNNISVASLWKGTRESWINLHPANSGGTSSSAYGVSGTQQVGSVMYLGESPHAVLWSGTPQSWIKLGPVDSGHSSVFDVSGGVQCGYAKFGPYWHAGLWKGTKESWVSLHPPGAAHSFAKAIHGDQQGGAAWLTTEYRAGLRW
jgi:hypothetical protein